MKKERIDFIKSIFEKDRKKFFFLPKKWIGEVKYYLIDTRKREDLNWLYPGNKKNKWEPKVKKQKNKKSKNVNFLKERTQEIPEIKKLHKRDKEERSRRREKDLNDPIYLKLLEKSLTEKTLLGGPKKTKKKKIAKNKDDKYVDAMYYRLPGSFGTGKRR
ncbi:hypothetical protein [Paenibacillus larvae]|uniref:hypothetical protein n=1 Tax=Paenibacillus larvae TaxID=1464 RepID=UPI002853E81B|nr:hypothetical protein [Paenibacillus larvae]MDR5608908.1 hypothetical protein [Paenibacillus larvae]